MIRIGICDDKCEDIRLLEQYAEWFRSKHPEIPIKTESFTSPFDLLDIIAGRGGYDIYILDIIMPRFSGIDLAHKIRERGETAEILFLTVSREYAVEAFGVKASGYLIKPVEKADFERELLDCIRSLAPKDNPSILLKTREGVLKLRIQDIITVESFNHNRVFTLSDGTTVETKATLSSLVELLRKYSCFFHPHRAYIVNLDHVNGLTATNLIMTDGRRIPISRNIYPKLKKAYMDYAFKTL